jgi:hypothetical protein
MKQKILQAFTKTIKILSVISLIISAVNIILVNGDTEYCYGKVNSRWDYRMVLEYTNAFKELSFFCRVFGFSCDSEHKSLNSMQREGMKIYNKYGADADYMSVIYKYSKEYFNDFFKWFCNTIEIPPTFFTLESIPTCPRTYRCSRPSWIKSCNKNIILNDECHFPSSLPRMG